MARKPELLFGKYFPATIKTKAFLKPYLESLYGNPVIFNSNDLFGVVIAGLLQRPTDPHKSNEALAFRVFDKLETDVTIYFPKPGKKNVVMDLGQWATNNIA